MLRKPRYLTLFIFVILFAHVGVAHSANLVRGPYLQMATEDTITIRWRTSTATDSVVYYGAGPNDLTFTETLTGGRTEHEIKLSGLTARTQYYYAVGDSDGIIAGGDTNYRFTTSPENGVSTPTRIWIIGDSGTANTNAANVYNAYLNHPGADNTHLWLMLGDNAYNDGTDSQYQNAVFNMYPELLRRTPLWPTLGNHDGYTADSASESGPYYDIFTLPRQAEAGGLASGTEAYYSFDYGDIHFICLDSYETSRSPNGAMMTWLENDIAATDKNWIIAFWHHPPYTKGSHNSDIEGRLIDMRKNALPILESHGVDLVFTGHSHSYERSYLIDGHYGSSSSFSSANLVDSGDGKEGGDGAYDKGGQLANAGTVYTVAGASGKISGGSLNHPAMFTSLNQLGSVVLDVNGNRLDAKYLRSDGTVSDAYTLIKGPDLTPPTVYQVRANSATDIVVNFSEPVLAEAASDITNYALNADAAILAATVSGSEVRLTSSPLTQNFLYTLTVNNIEDLHGNSIAENTQQEFLYQNIQTLSFQDGMSPSGQYGGTRDTTLASGKPNDNYGADDTLLADGYDGSNGELATLLAWDLSAVPTGAQVIGGEIVLQVFNPSSGTYNLYQNTVAWQEDTVTWSTIEPELSRGPLVGSFQPTSNGSVAIAFNDAGMSMLQSWLDESASLDEVNNGLLIMTAGSTNGIDLRSSEYGSQALRPRLNLTYVVDSSSNPVPQASFDFTANSLSVDFVDTSANSSSGIVSWLWSFGDGNTSSLQNPSYNYAVAGVYEVVLTVTDAESNTDSYVRMITLNDITEPQTIELQQGLDSYLGAEDTYVAEGRENTSYGNSSEILADGDDGSRDELISLLKWDLSSIPTGVTVTNVSIVLQVHNRSSGVYNLWEMTAPWSQASATWNNTSPRNNRGINVGSFTPESTGAYTLVLNANGVASVQAWVDGYQNNGFTIESGGTRNGIDMRSSEYGNVTERPKLIVTYQ